MMLQLIAAQRDFYPSLRDWEVKSKHAGVKRVAFVLDYSGNNTLCFSKVVTEMSE